MRGERCLEDREELDMGIGECVAESADVKRRDFVQSDQVRCCAPDLGGDGIGALGPVGGDEHTQRRNEASLKLVGRCGENGIDVGPDVNILAVHHQVAVRLALSVKGDLGGACGRDGNRGAVRPGRSPSPTTLRESIPTAMLLPVRQSAHDGFSAIAAGPSRSDEPTLRAFMLISDWRLIPGLLTCCSALPISSDRSLPKQAWSPTALRCSVARRCWRSCCGICEVPSPHHSPP